MTTDHPTAAGTQHLARHLSAEQVRTASFDRAPFGRRGFDEEEVQRFLHQVGDELAWRDAEIARLASENRQLKHALREWHRQLVGYDAAELIARTQQHIEAQIAQAEAYSREREEEATRRYDEIIAEARRRALTETQRLVHEAGAGGAGAAEPDGDRNDGEEWLARQQVYAHALLQSLDALAAHVHATRQAFTFEISRLGDISDGGGTAADIAASPTPMPDQVVLASGPAPRLRASEGVEPADNAGRPDHRNGAAGADDPGGVADA